MSSPERVIPELPAPGGFWTEPGPSVAALRRAHGDLFRLNFPAGRTVHCAVGVEAHKSLLIDHIDQLSNFDPLIRMGFMPPATAGGLITMNPGAEHRWFRKVLTPAFSSASVTAHMPVIREIAARRLHDWSRRGAVELYGEMGALAFHVTAALALGVKATDDVAGLHDVFRDLTRHRAGMGERVAQELGPLIRSRREQPTQDALGALIHAGAPNGPISDAQILGHVNTLLVAGHFTTAALGSYLLFLLAIHPRLLAQVTEEQLAIDASDMQGLGRLEHLDNALMEAERLMPPVPHLARRLVQDVEFQGHRLNAGDFVFCSISGTHRDPALFADPDSFDPSRFAPPRSERRRHPLALAGFSVGARRCLGALLAQVTLKVAINQILRRFTLRPERTSYPGIYRPVLRPTGPMPFRIEARS